VSSGTSTTFVDLSSGQFATTAAVQALHLAGWDGGARRGRLGADQDRGQPPGPWPAGHRLTARPLPGPKPPVTGPGRRAGDRLILRREDLPLAAEVIPSARPGPSGSTGHRPVPLAAVDAPARAAQLLADLANPPAALTPW
jgi:hypothetical protein